MNIWSAILLLFFIVYCSSLHLLQTIIYNQQRYLEAIQSLKDRLKDDLDKIKTSLEGFKRELATTEGNDTQRIKMLKKGLSNERNQLIDLQGYLKLPYGLKACRCKGFTEDLKSNFNNNWEVASSSIQKLKEDMLQWPNCRLANELRSQLYRQQQYLTIMKDVANSECHRPPKSFLPDQPTGLINLNQSKYVSNLQNSKWIFGSISSTDFKYQIFTLSSKTNLTKCPEEKPFTRDGKTCIDCPNNNPIWSVGDSTCTTCGVGQHYNSYGHNCSFGDPGVEEQQAKSKGIGLYGGQKRDPASGYNRNRHGTNYINTPPDVDPDLKTCSISQPFFNGRACISCRLPQLFNFDTMSCEGCPSGTTFSIKHKICSSRNDTKHVTNLNARNLIVGIDKTLSDYKQQQESQISQNRNLSVCPAATPYFDGETCISCTGIKPYFNLYSQQCQTCDAGFSYFQTLNNCTVNIYLTNTMGKGIIHSGNNTGASIYQQASVLKRNNPYNKLQLCPVDKPFAKNFVCITCPEQNPLFDISTQQCTRCHQQASYDQQTSKCIGKFLTSPNAPNLYFKGISREEYSQQYQSLRSRFNQIQDCPHESPYFDGSRCVSCGQSTPIFSIRTKMCGQCPLGKVYSSQNGDCIIES